MGVKNSKGSVRGDPLKNLWNFLCSLLLVIRPWPICGAPCSHGYGGHWSISLQYEVSKR